MRKSAKSCLINKILDLLPTAVIVVVVLWGAAQSGRNLSSLISEGLMSYVFEARRRAGLVLGVVLLAVVGCTSQAGDRLPITGHVNFQGKPLERGTIEFTSADRQQQTGAVINQGAFSIAAAQGLPPGKYVARISSVEEGATPPADLPPGPEARDAANLERIPSEFNTNSKLTIELSADKTEFTFDIP
jgi:hypothetical protein